jgi:hypothetical protein
MTDPRSLAAIQSTERFVEGEVDVSQMVEIETAAHRALRDIELRPPVEGGKRTAVPGLLAAQVAFHLVAEHGKRADWCAWAVFRSSAHIQALPGLTPDPAEQRRWTDQLRTMAQLLRDLFGNPFHPVRLATACRTSQVQALAQAAYEDRAMPLGHFDPARLAVLSDALEDAGCTDAEILAHLRSHGPHVRGCWALDLILGKS